MLFKRFNVNAAKLTPRQEFVEAIRYRVFGTCPTNNPFMPPDKEKTRSGRKFLMKNLQGPAMLGYYTDPEVKPLPRLSKQFQFGDDKQLRAQYKNQVLKNTGRGKPKKLAGGKKGKKRK
jgi:hypothetical protein